jgi:hypothetical protein
MRSPGLVTYLGMDGSSPLWAEPIKGESAPVRGVPLAAVVTTMLMRVLMEKFLCQGLMGQNPTLECHSDSCAWVPVATPYHARPFGGVASHGPGYGTCLVLESPRASNMSGCEDVPQ